MIIRSTGHAMMHLLWRESVHHFYSLDAAFRFLEPFKQNPGRMAELRSLLAERRGPVDFARAPDGRVLLGAARLLVRRELLVGIEWKGRLPAVAGDREAEPAPSAAAPPPSTQPEDSATFSGDHDGATQAAALRNAAASGVPFCEECTHGGR